MPAYLQGRSQRIEDMVKDDAVLASAPIGPCRVQVRQRWTIGKDYDAPARLDRVRLVLQSDGNLRTRTLRSLASVRRVASDLGLHIEDEVRAATLAFAEVVARWKGLGVVIQPTFRFSYVRQLYGRKPVGPVFRGSTLRFFTAQLSLKRLFPPLREVSVHLPSFRVTSRVVAKARKPEELDRRTRRARARR